MYIATKRDVADVFLGTPRSAAVSTPLSVRLRTWLTEAWAEHKRRRMERIVSEIGHPGVIAEMRRARERREALAAWN